MVNRLYQVILPYGGRIGAVKVSAQGVIYAAPPIFSHWIGDTLTDFELWVRSVKGTIKFVSEIP